MFSFLFFTLEAHFLHHSFILEFTMKKISQGRINNIKKHLLDGLTISEVMRETNESRGTVQRVKETMDLPPSNNKGGRPKVFVIS